MLVLGISAVFLFDAVERDPAVPFLTHTHDPEWIAVYSDPETNAIRVDPDDVPVQTFWKAFDLPARPAEARLHLRALGDAQVRLNGEPLWRSDPARSWKRQNEVDATPALRPGSNEIRVRVANPRGPALLQLRLADGAGRVLLETDASWQAVDSRGVAAATMRADDTRPHPESFFMSSTGSVLVAKAPVLGLLFALGAALHLALRRTLPRSAAARAPLAVLVGVVAFHVLVYALRTSRLPVVMGFDVIGHLAYIDYLLAHRALPLATDGGSMYHPPLGHALIAGLVALTDVSRDAAAGRWLYRLPTFLAALGNVFAAWLTARRLFDDDPLRTSLAVAFAGLLPMNVYMGAYVSNEPIHSFFVSLALCIACGLLMRANTPPSRVAALTGSLGLAILTKFTALLAVPLSAAFVAAKVRLVDRASALRALATAGAMLAGVAALAGWVYVRNWQLFGRPVVGNWDVPGGVVWWEQPGYHTAAYYTSFGQALSYPFFSGYASFWDGLYSTFWGDGLVAGMARLSTRHDAWSYDFMTAGYWLAFPATVLLFAGFGRAVAFAFREDEIGRRLAMSLLVAFLYAAAFALLSITLRLPYYAQAKAFYVLSAIVPLSVVGALGLAWLLERLSTPGWLPVRMLYSGWLATLAGSLVLSFLG